MPANSPLPTELDFDPCRGDLDAVCAWKNFGGLSLEDAYAKFCSNPLYYQEDFMFMGGVAFAFYFPIIDRYIREAHASVVDREEVIDLMSILACCLENQFDRKSPMPVVQIRPQVKSLVEHVCIELLPNYSAAEQQDDIESTWLNLESHLNEHCKIMPD